MTLIDDRPARDYLRPEPGNLSSLLGAGLATLDIGRAERELAVRRYRQVGSEIAVRWEGARGDNTIYPQGSFRLGTVVRRIDRNDDIDIDCVALRDLSRGSTSQEQLKSEVGEAVRAFARGANADGASVVESDRCWTLQWDGMHLDVLPALPVEDTSSSKIYITDKNLRNWQLSAPIGYADWFRSRMAVELRERQVLAKETYIEDVPEREIKTTLQRSVQALKRHRDLYFLNRPGPRVSSIIITTVAATAFVGGRSLVEELRSIVSQIPGLIEYSSGQWFLPNPVESSENFADYWASDPKLAEVFFEWLAVLSGDLGLLVDAVGLDIISARLESSFGSRVSSGAMASIATRMTGGRESGSVTMGAVAGGLALASAASAASFPRVAKPNHFHGGSRY